ncbi:hypothetical protein PGB90_002798 [Kerria lacca]
MAKLTIAALKFSVVSNKSSVTIRESFVGHDAEYFSQLVLRKEIGKVEGIVCLVDTTLCKISGTWSLPARSVCS